MDCNQSKGPGEARLARASNPLALPVFATVLIDQPCHQGPPACKMIMSATQLELGSVTKASLQCQDSRMKN